MHNHLCLVFGIIGTKGRINMKVKQLSYFLSKSFSILYIIPFKSLQEYFFQQKNPLLIIYIYDSDLTLHTRKIKTSDYNRFLTTNMWMFVVNSERLF